MNKIIKGSLGLLAAAFLAAGCVDQRAPMAIYDPANTTAPTLSNVATVTTLAPDGEDIVIDFGNADYGISCAVRYTLYASVTSDFESPEVMAATIADGKATMTQKSLNSYILNKGGVPDQECTVYFRLHSDMSNDQNTAVSGTELSSNVASGVFVPYDMLVSDKDTYKYIYVIGSYCNWKHTDPTLQFLFNYAKDDKTYSGIIDFGNKAADGFKLTGGADWNNGNWGVNTEAAAPGTEAGSVSLIDDGGSGNIACYSDRFYMFSFDKSSLTLTKEYSFNQMGVIGLNGDWDNDVVMEYNPGYNRFYADVTANSNTAFKFRLNGTWGTNWGDSGKGLEQGGGDIPIAEGNYRIYFDVNKMEYQVSAGMYGQPEPGLPEVAPAPVKPTAWSLAGNFNSWNAADEAYNLSNLDGDFWVLRSASFAAGDEFKLVANHDWSNENYGGPEENSTSTIEAGNPYGVYKPEMGVEFELGGKNIQILEAGEYDIILNYESKTLVVNKHVKGFSLIGAINGDTWKWDVMMSQEGNVWTSPTVSIEGEFKIRYNYSWADADCYGAPEAGFVPTIGASFVASQPGSDITVAEKGHYKVSFNSETKEVTINAVEFPDNLYMTGDEFGNWDWNSSEVVSLVPVHNNGDKAPGQFWTVRYFSAGKNFKFCPARAWNGQEFNSLTTNEGFTVSGGNCTVDQDGFYMVHIDLKNSILHIEPARIYGIGSCFGGWDEGMENALFTADGKTLKCTLVADGELRMYAASSRATSDWWTREFIFLDGKIEYRGKGDDQQRVNAGAGQTVVLDFNAGTATLQ